MDEDLVKEKLPEVYQSIIKTEEDVDWEQIKEDLEDLNWLDFDEKRSYDNVIAIWKVVDRWGVSVLQSSPRFKLFKLSKVKMPITNHIYNIQNSDEIKLICKESRSKIEDLLFFACAKGQLYAASEENLPNLALRIHDVFIEFRGISSQFFIHFDKQLKIEVNSTVAKILDESFYIKVLMGFKSRLLSEESTKKMVSEFSTSSVGVQDASTGDSPSYSDMTPATSSYIYPNNHSNYLRENIYKGELSQENKREGYGKVTFFGGDTYEGYWLNDKPHGLGLYVWKIGGSYLGNFEKGYPNGCGKRVYYSGNWFEGEFVNGKKQGKGEMHYKNGDVYEGEWQDDCMHGQGKYTWATGDSFVGRFFKDYREGNGVLSSADGMVTGGLWRDNQYVSN